jgi:recX family
MRVTGIETTKKGRYALMVDGEFAFSLHRDTFLLCPWLQKGAEVSPERLETLRQEDELRSARERALDLLSAAEQTSGTLRQKLLRWYGEEAVEAAVLRMEELGLINDLDYGRRYAADAVNLRGWPRRRIAMELQKKGIPAEVIEEALADITEETEIETACRLLEGPYRGRLRDRRERDKVKAALQRRGFSYEVIRQAVSRAMEALPEDGETPEPEETPETGDGQEELLALIRKKYAKNMADRAGMEKTIAALYRRGYPLEEIKAAMAAALEALPEGGETPEPEETPETGDGQEELLALIRKKYAKNMTDRAGKEKTIAALYRRGYPLEAIKAAMNTILEQEENCRDD